MVVSYSALAMLKSLTARSVISNKGKGKGNFMRAVHIHRARLFEYSRAHRRNSELRVEVRLLCRFLCALTFV